MRASQLSTARPDPGEAPPKRPRRRDGEQLVLGRYRLGGRLGAGSFGTVWAARDEHLEREVAVKVIPRERIMDARFEREARTAARLSHPAIVTLYEALADDDSAYLVSELVRGATLDQLLESGRLSDRDIVAIVVALCGALAHAHGQGIVHRDVKPSNVLVPDHAASTAYPAKLTDFGVARVIGGDSLTKTGEVIGTAAYMAPEQAVGRAAEAPADLYSLALVLYEALTGLNPIAGSAGQRAARLRAYLPPVRRQRRDLPRELGRGIDLALRPRPRERGTVQEFQLALSASLSELKDIPGVVEGPWRPRLSTRAPAAPGAATSPDAVRSPLLSPPARGRQRPREVADAQRPAGPLQGTGASTPVPWPRRGLGAACAGLLGAWLGSRFLGQAVAAPAALALIAGGAVLLLPRIGFVLLGVTLTVAAAAGGQPGEALLVAAALCTPALLLARSGSNWPLAIGAPLLGAVGLAGAWPALAARASNSWQRAALGFIGWLWLIAAELLTGSRFYLRLPAAIPPRTVWAPSIFHTAHHVLGALEGSGVIAGALVWALAAALLPMATGSGSLARSTLKVTAWALGLVAATAIALTAGSGLALRSFGVVMAGTVAAVLVALGPTALRAWRSREVP